MAKLVEYTMFKDHGKAFAAFGEFLQVMSERLLLNDAYSIGQYYLDLGWGVEYLVEAEVPFFTGKYAENWLLVAQHFTAHGQDVLDNQKTPIVPLDFGQVPALTAHALFTQIIRDTGGFRSMLMSTESRVNNEIWDSELDEEGKRSISIAERVKVLFYFTLQLRNTYFPYVSHQDRPHDAWLVPAMDELEGIFLQMGEPKQSVPWGVGDNDGGGWSRPA